MIKTVQLGEIEFAIKIDVPLNSRVGLIFSGGIDSTLLLILLNRLKQERNLQITTFTIENNCGYEYFATSILSDPLFAGIKGVMSVENGGDFSGFIDNAIEKIMSRNDLDLVFTGVNAVPEALKMIDHPIRPTEEIVANYSKLRCPLLNATKDVVIKAFMQHLDSHERRLFLKTRSCTNVTVNNCGQCYQCIEKKWAMDQIGVTEEDFF